MRSVHFSPAIPNPLGNGKAAAPSGLGKATNEKPPAASGQVELTRPQVNVLDTLNQAQSEAHLIAVKLNGLVKAGSGRHGDLQVALSTLRRLEPLIEALIAVEEN